MHRIFCVTRDAPVIGQRVLLSPAEAHHVRDVLRATSGAKITLVHVPSRTELVTRLEVRTDQVAAIVEEAIASGRARSRARTLCPALLKGSHNDLLVEKCTELGVERFIFWHAERSVVTLPPTRLAERERRLRAIGEAAARQSQQVYLPEVTIVNTLAALYQKLEPRSGSVYFCSLQPSVQELRSMEPPDEATIVIGPEGDFTEAEQALLQAEGAVPISLGPTILRAETCAIAATAAATAVWGWLPAR